MRLLSAIAYLVLTVATAASGLRLGVSDHDLHLETRELTGFFVFLDAPPNDTVNVEVTVPEGADVVDFPGGRSFSLRNAGNFWVNLTAKRAGHATVLLNTSVASIDTKDAFVRVSVLKMNWIDVVSSVFGWIYFVAWSVSFYPQIFLNWKRKSVVGLSFDFIGLNLTGFLAYSFFNIGMFFSKDVQAEYLLQHPTGVIPVEINDIVFGIHASFATFITVLQCCFYERQDQRVSLPARVLLGVIWTGAVVFGIVTVAGGNPHSPWLTYLYFFSYSKLVITLIKYIPQAYLNFRRKSTVGWSIGNILLDFTGGSLSMLQMFLIAYNYDDWSSLFGNFTKFGLGFISISFDLLFIIQHYVLYRHAPAITETDADEARPMEFIAVKRTED
ncbi:cystinosin homolog [Ixodes scapularis]|uniref:cystinosin homolog n=1 Tax=Ixodes scapularis TaxID=6945 RepID=UPI001C38EE0B|nr:cystinosin homolog [Ixodes scapularis]